MLRIIVKGLQSISFRGGKAGGVWPDDIFLDDNIPETKFPNTNNIFYNFPEAYLPFYIFPEDFHPPINHFPENTIYRNCMFVYTVCSSLIDKK